MLIKRLFVGIGITCLEFLLGFSATYLGSKPAQKLVHSVRPSWTNLHCLLMERVWDTEHSRPQSSVLSGIDWQRAERQEFDFCQGQSLACAELSILFQSWWKQPNTNLVSLPHASDVTHPYQLCLLKETTVRHLRLKSVQLTRILLQTAYFSSGWSLQTCGFTLYWGSEFIWGLFVTKRDRCRSKPCIVFEFIYFFEEYLRVVFIQWRSMGSKVVWMLFKNQRITLAKSLYAPIRPIWWKFPHDSISIRNAEDVRSNAINKH